MKIKAVLLVLVFLSWASTGWAGWIIEEEDEDGRKGTVYIQENKLKSEDQDLIIIYDLDNETLSILEPRQKVFWSGKPESFLEEMRKAMTAQMEGMLKTLPPEEREAAKKQMQAPEKSAGAEEQVDVVIKRTGRTAVIAGHQTKMYQVWFEGELRQELWIAESVTAAKEFDLNRMAEILGALDGLGEDGFDDLAPPIIELMTKGYPLKTVDYLGDDEKAITTVTRVVQKKLDRAVFQPPAEFRKKKLAEVMGLGQ